MAATPKGVTISLIQSNTRFASFSTARFLTSWMSSPVRRGAALRLADGARGSPSSCCIPRHSSMPATPSKPPAPDHEIDSNALFVRDGERIGIITGMNLSKAVVLRRQPIETGARVRAFRRGDAAADDLYQRLSC